MKKSIMGVLALLWVSMIVLGGCSSPKVKIFSLESPQKITVTSISGEKMEVADEDIIQQITDNITSIQFERGESSEDTNGFGPIISWYNSNGDVMETITVMSNDTIIYSLQHHLLLCFPQYLLIEQHLLLPYQYFQKIAGRLILILNWECHMHRWRAE